MKRRGAEALIRRLHRDLKTIHKRRTRLGIPAFAKRRIAWTPAMDRKLGKITDEMLALKLGCSASAVTYRRRQLKVPACGRVFGR